MTGFQLSQYRIDAELGRGGMGIVYRATDTKLNRTVALKVLPAAALASDDDRARFYREAQAAAQLHHPHIATVFQIDEAVPVEEGRDPQPGTEPRLFIAMEFVDGETLSDRISRAPLPLTDVVSFSTQVAEALKAAHAKDIVHRDIKSANVMITRDGVIKVLDFGLAKTTNSTMLTRMGSTVGTVAYMSPEQARGQEVDGRTDLYSLGAVMYEMVSGRLPFAGDYEQAVMYGIRNENPEPLTALRTGVPMSLEFVVNKLLSKDAEYRYQSAAGLLADLKSLDLTGSGHSRRSVSGVSSSRVTASHGGVAPTSDSEGRAWPIKRVVGLAVATLVAGAAAGWLLRSSPQVERPPVRQYELVLDDIPFAFTPHSSPDGRYWAIMVPPGPDVLLFDAREGTRTQPPALSDHRRPRFSPSGQWLLTFSRGALYRTRIPSGSPTLITEARGGMWLSDAEVLVVDDDRGLSRVSVENGQRTRFEISGPDSTYQAEVQTSEWLPESGLIVAEARRGDSWDLLAIDEETGEVTVLRRGARFGGVIDQWMVFATEQGEVTQVLAQRFDASGPALIGVPVDVHAGVNFSFDVGRDGVFRRIQRPFGRAGPGEMTLSWMDPESGQLEGLRLEPGPYDRFSFSPDGRSLAIQRATDDESVNIYILDLATGTERRLTYTHAINRAPAWGRSGKVYYSTGAEDTINTIVRKNADGSGDEETVSESGDWPDVTEDERWVAFTRRAERSSDLWARNLETGEEVAIDTTSRIWSGDVSFSPNGRYVAYSHGGVQNPNQRVIVRSFPDVGRQYVQVTDEYGDDPGWSPEGDYLLFRNRGQLYRMRVDTGDTFGQLSGAEPVATLPGVTFRLHFNPADGRFLVAHSGDSESAAPPNVKVYVIESFVRYLEELAAGANP